MKATAGRAAAQVDGDIEDAPRQNPHQLGLREGRELEMQAAHRAPRMRDGLVVLHESVVQPRLRQKIPAVGLAEPAALISVAAWRDENDVGDGEASNVHGHVSSDCLARPRSA
jgi:hypothetical protein